MAPKKPRSRLERPQGFSWQSAFRHERDCIPAEFEGAKQGFLASIPRVDALSRTVRAHK